MSTSRDVTPAIKELYRCFIPHQDENEPLSWDFAIKCHEADYFLSFRRKSIQKEYKKSKVTTESKWDDISSQIKHEVFGMESSFDENLNKRTVKEDIHGYYFIYLMYFVKLSI